MDADKKFKQGWDPDKNRMIVVGNAGANMVLGNGGFLRHSKSPLSWAELRRKHELSDLPGGGFSRKYSFNSWKPWRSSSKRTKALKDLLKKEEEFAAQAQKEAADILKSVDSARADELEGVTVGDRLNRLLEAAIRKIDESYTEGSIAEDKKQRVRSKPMAKSSNSRRRLPNETR